MARFKLLVGQHVQADRSKPILDGEGKPTGRYERKTYTAVGGNQPVVESDADLVAKFGPEKFAPLEGRAAEDAAKIAKLEAELARLRSQAVAPARTPGDPTPENLRDSPSVAPGGQVSTGYPGGEVGGDAGNGGEEGDDLEDRTVHDLKDIADAEEIDVSGARGKAALVAAIREGRRKGG